MMTMKSVFWRRKPEYPEETGVPGGNRSTRRKPEYPEETGVPGGNLRGLAIDPHLQNTSDDDNDDDDTRKTTYTLILRLMSIVLLIFRCIAALKCPKINEKGDPTLGPAHSFNNWNEQKPTTTFYTWHK